MNKLQYLPKINRRQHIITLKDIFSYYDVTKLTGNGNLRVKYGRKDKRDLVVSIFNAYIAEMLDLFVEGGIVFNFPDKHTSKMIFKKISSEVVKKAKVLGKLKNLDPIASNFTGIETVIKVSSENAFYEHNVILSKNFQEKIYDKVNKKQNLIGKVDRVWKDFTEIIYNTFADIDRTAIDKVIRFGLKKIIYFLSNGLEIFIHNTVADEFIYIGRQINKHKDIDFKYRMMTKQYIKKLRWHYNNKRVFEDVRYYHLTEEMYKKHLSKETLDSVVLKRIVEECLIGKPYYKYVMKTNSNSYKHSTLIKDYDSSNDELIFTK